MSDNKEFIEFYNQTRENHVKMHTWGIHGLSVCGTLQVSVTGKWLQSWTAKILLLSPRRAV